MSTDPPYGPPTPVPRKTDAEIDQLAIDILTNVMYWPRNIEDLQERFKILLIFMTAMPGNLGWLYERTSEVGPYGNFFTAQMIASEDMDRLQQVYHTKHRALYPEEAASPVE